MRVTLVYFGVPVDDGYRCENPTCREVFLRRGDELADNGQEPRYCSRRCGWLAYAARDDVRSRNAARQATRPPRTWARR